MRASLLLATVGLSVVLAACASTATDDTPTSTEGDKTLPAPAGSTPPPPTGTPTPDGGTPPAAPDCSLAALTGVPDIDAAFLPPGTMPPAMTGGTLDGEYVVEKATVYLPSGSAGLVDATKSTGKVAAWAVFKGPRYRLYLKSAFTIVSVLGPQAQSVDTESQGGFTSSAGVLTLDHACDTALADEADYSFKDDGSGGATILIKTPTPYGDTYLELDALKH